MMSWIDEWLNAAEYILAHGNQMVLLCERGIRTFETATRNTLDLRGARGARAVAPARDCRPEPRGGRERRFIPPMARAALASGPRSHGGDPSRSEGRLLLTGPRPLTFDMFETLMYSLARPKTPGREGARLRGQEDELTEEDLSRPTSCHGPASSRPSTGAAAGERRARAVKTLQRAVDLDPCHPVALEMLGSLWLKLNQPERGHHSLGRRRSTRRAAPPSLAHVFMRLRCEREAHAMAAGLERHPGETGRLEVLRHTRRRLILGACSRTLSLRHLRRCRPITRRFSWMSRSSRSWIWKSAARLRSQIETVQHPAGHQLFAGR